MKNLKTNHEALHALDDRAREYLAYMQATLKGASDDFANKYLLSENPYIVYESGNENDEPLEEFDSIDRLKEWCYLQKAAAIASGKKPLEYYYNYCYSVEEGGDFL